MANLSRVLVTKKSDGTEVKVYEYSSEIETTHMGSKARSFIPGTRWLELDDGSSVNYIDKNTFKIVETGEILKLAD